MSGVIGVTKEELIALDPRSVNRQLSKEEIIYIATTLGAYWQYDYEAVKQGRPGMHAILKSELHSDGFFISRILLEFPNIRCIIANQLVLKFNQLEIPKPDWIAGIPDGATKLGKDVAEIMGVKKAEMKKEDDRIVLVSSLGAGDSLLLVEDFCTRGTGFTEAISAILSKQPEVKILPYELVILNRGGLKEIVIEGVDSFKIVPAAEHRVNDWKPEECPLCKMGSTPIKPTTSEKSILPPRPFAARRLN